MVNGWLLAIIAVVDVFNFQRIRGLPSNESESQLTVLEIERLPPLNVHLSSLKIDLGMLTNIDKILTKVPSLRSLTISFRSGLDFSFLQTCSNLEIFHPRPVHKILSQSDAEHFSHLRSLVEIDLADTYLSCEAMTTLLESLPKTLRRFRHASNAAMRCFSLVVKLFPKLEQFNVAKVVHEVAMVWLLRRVLVLVPHVVASSCA